MVEDHLLLQSAIGRSKSEEAEESGSTVGSGGLVGTSSRSERGPGSAAIETGLAGSKVGVIAFERLIYTYNYNGLGTISFSHYSDVIIC